MRLAESVIAGVLIMLGGGYAYGILQIRGREFTSNEIGPAAFPWLLVTLLVVLGVIILARECFSPMVQRGESFNQSRAVIGKTLVAALLLITYAGSLEAVGFLWSTPIFLALLSPLYGAHRLSIFVIAVMAIGFTAALHSVLWFGFDVLLP